LSRLTAHQGLALLMIAGSLALRPAQGQPAPAPDAQPTQQAPSEDRKPAPETKPADDQKQAPEPPATPEEPKPAESQPGPPPDQQTQPPPANPAGDTPVPPPEEKPPVPPPPPPVTLEPIPPDQVYSILGKSVHGPAGEDMGRVVDLLFDKETHPRAVVIDFGGFLGVGTRRIAIDWQLLHFEPDNKTTPIVLDLGKDEIKGAPEYKDTAQPPTMVGPPTADAGR